MNIQVTNVIAPAAPKSIEDTGLNVVMMRDILLKTIFRMNLELVSDISRTIAMPIPITQELIDLARSQRLLRSRHHKVEVRTKPLVITVLDFNFEKRTEMDAHFPCSSRPMSVIGSPGMKGSWSWMVTSRAR